MPAVGVGVVVGVSVGVGVGVDVGVGEGDGWMGGDAVTCWFNPAYLHIRMQHQRVCRVLA